ncbi:hypothetical protein [Spirosoma sp.]|uniref:hypothetical protein n=1 Tax=Spirosoma sp. TaxID=1899569 RepID=UPI003B3BB0C5
MMPSSTNVRAYRYLLVPFILLVLLMAVNLLFIVLGVGLVIWFIRHLVTLLPNKRYPTPIYDDTSSYPVHATSFELLTE